MRTSSAGSASDHSDHKGSARFDLIETMRIEGGRVPLLDLHLGRLDESAAALGFAFDKTAAKRAIDELYGDRAGPAMLRLLLARSGAIALELADLPPSLPEPAVCAVLRLPIDPADRRLRHNTTDRGFYAAALGIAQRAGAHEALLLRDDGLLTEGSFTTLFVERNGMLLTPPATLGLRPGVLRASLIAQGRVREAELRPDDLADGFLIGNALCGLMTARLLT